LGNKLREGEREREREERCYSGKKKNGKKWNLGRQPSNMDRRSVTWMKLVVASTTMFF
jgi:hypothetical protein